jgi:putative transposase
VRRVLAVVLGRAVGRSRDLAATCVDSRVSRRAIRVRAVIHHLDQGCQYTSIAFGQRCREVGVKPSVGSVGDAYDNAMCESFFATLECELLERRRFKSQVEAEMDVFDFIEGFYNPRRLHSALDYQSPVQYERTEALAA